MNDAEFWAQERADEIRKYGYSPIQPRGPLYGVTDRYCKICGHELDKYDARVCADCLSGDYL